MIEAQSNQELVDVGQGVTLCCERLGNPADPPLLLIPGLGQQLLSWPDPFCDALGDRGLHVIRVDNRDIGRSWHASTHPPSRGQLLTRRFDHDQYTLADMARDIAGLLDALELAPAHVVGISMGGMIAQTLAASSPRHVRSLVSMLSSTGAASAGWAAPSTVRLMLTPPARTREQAQDRALRMWRHVGSHGFPFDEDRIRDLAGRSFDRDPRAAAGTGRQLAAVLKSGDRTRSLRQITAPTLVIHGDRDRMVHPSGGRATAAAIPGARLTTIAGLGHDLPAGAFDGLIELIAAHAGEADRAQSAPVPA
ncbi:MAG TPA: alpha/beta fold hydrolase [Solirubrobacteraceae bacterium]|nr:alpha/beta fold hydrolase [Solirubrobacteraceae bacterium]